MKSFSMRRRGEDGSRVVLLDQGIGVFPIVTPGKTPACSSWDDYVCTRNQAARFGNYGVRLGVLAVADSDSSASKAWVAANLPPTPFMVNAARGRHRYYRLEAATPKFIHRDGHAIEFRNQGQYVVGPGSVHKLGMTYTASDWSWDWNDIPIFPADFVWDDRPPSATTSTGYVIPATTVPASATTASIALCEASSLAASHSKVRSQRALSRIKHGASHRSPISASSTAFFVVPTTVRMPTASRARRNPDGSWRAAC